MTDLQMGLIGLGAAAVVGVLAYNKWQEHKHRKLAESLLSARQADVLLDEQTSAIDDAGGMTARPDQGRVEPLLDPATKPNVVSAARPVPVDDDEALPASERSAQPARTDEERPVIKTFQEVTAPLYLLSPTIDYIAAIEVSESAAAYQIREAQRVALARLGKPVHWIGFNEQEHEWEPILEDADSAYRHIRIGLQLVDRQGPVRDGDLSIFHLAMQDLATELMGFAELPLREPALRIASQLDEFCAGVDIQIGVNVISQGQVFPGTKLRALAESAGMTIDSEGRFARFDDEGRLLYVLINQETQGFSAESMRALTTHGVTFLLDVPRVANGDRVLIQMVELARRFADALHGALVDDNRRPLSEGSIEPIRRQVVQYQTAMATRQVPAGGALALRLFS
ncbi:MAG: cell division protein ZipA C-terminal FtsZ-binding domain-containing protein [Candidatus Accumulibacter sp.]|uniref:Cell division protein ZipA n=2 Tax=Candidatus Accumulibacter TaxID=327159 RepID=A0A080MA34_9PROT|nr:MULTISPECIES: cell division protein ZipA C-terminal FtsZ-binding domain-containing protein [Candidatus Accumulibacter]KFB78083.1 MAG: cell division protein ZipA [Candidatus Accumulibacter cognatus]MBL8401945.1 cell division protein ZipA C-terminal FtsZ-binding domain-containing protein [Accumulibacter sp.]MBN8518488.1 cell division protein ZipA C-terminal FtsZ-binding domain-containing protein [Accumulibacter sp.]MBO3709934.1 cell division protein ZipA C-terminal FtsZ-binding domain-containi